jgi:flagellar secretion chaperone FliS
MPSARDQYLETQVLTATPQRLRLMLIEGALRTARAAIEAGTQGDTASAAAAIGRCRDVVTELIAGISPDHSALARQVLGVYMFIYTALIESQFVFDARRLGDVVRILEEEQTTWRAVCEQMPERPTLTAAVEETAPQRVASSTPGYGGPHVFAPAPSSSQLSLEA